MTRDEKLEALAQVLLTAASKAKELSDTGSKDDYVSRETALAMQIEGIAREFIALARARLDGHQA